MKYKVLNNCSNIYILSIYLTMSTRLYEITGAPNYVIKAANIYGENKRIEIVYNSPSQKLQTVDLGTDGDEISVESYVLKDEHTIFITVKCNGNVVESYKKCELKDLFVGSINPEQNIIQMPMIMVNTPANTDNPNTPQEESIMKYQHWCGTCRK